MNIYLQQLVLAAAVVYIVDVSGFTESWREALARWLHVSELRALPPFDCGKCMTFWSTLVWTAVHGELSLFTFASCAAASLLAQPICQLLGAVQELLCALFDLINPNR